LHAVAGGSIRQNDGLELDHGLGLFFVKLTPLPICLAAFRDAVDGRRPPRRAPRRGFSLVEILVVCGIIAVLIAILVPAIHVAREQSLRAVCASNLKQWGTAVNAYASTNEGAFPVCDAPHLSWIGLQFQNFVNSYLMSQGSFNNSRAYNNTMHVQYCPTEYGYRGITNQAWTPPNGLELIGYFYLPGRLGQPQQYAAYSYFPPITYNRPQWATRTHVTGQYANAPIMMDIAEQMIPELGGWFDTTSEAGPRSAHVNRATGIPRGMNFLFLDSHVEWHDFAGVGIGATVPSNSTLYYDIPS
jgi:prepilin-type N-terminal cleavage/methylation domain-containing protein/prepilin-type processing-associated H-X9-DG protein